MKIQALAQRTGINTKTIRYYEEIGLLPPPARGENNYRRYAEQDMERLRLVAGGAKFMGVSTFSGGDPLKVQNETCALSNKLLAIRPELIRVQWDSCNQSVPGVVSDCVFRRESRLICHCELWETNSLHWEIASHTLRSGQALSLAVTDDDRINSMGRSSSPIWRRSCNIVRS